MMRHVNTSLRDIECQLCIDGVVTLVDADGDGVCDGEEVAGCQDESACNYNPDATDDAISGLNISLTAGFYASEITWTLNGEEFGAPLKGSLPSTKVPF